MSGVSAPSWLRGSSMNKKMHSHIVMKYASVSLASKRIQLPRADAGYASISSASKRLQLQLPRAVVPTASPVSVSDKQTDNDPSLPPLADIPVIDVNLLASLDSEEGQEELLKFKLALTSWGCFQAVGHGISSSYLDEIRETTKEFFALPLEEKQKCVRKPSSLEGYGDDPNVPHDRKVIFNHSSERILYQVAPDHKRRLYRWPTNPPNFRTMMIGYSAIMKHLSQFFVKAMAKSLSLEEDCFLQKYGDEELMALRFNYYPPRQNSEIPDGADPHSDGSAITILLQDKEVEGLQVLKDGVWYRVPIISPHALFVNLGDQMEIMSNGILKSPVHRVVVQEAEKERISVVSFHLPTYESEIGPVEALIDENRARQYVNLKDYRRLYYDSLFQGKYPLDMVKINAAAM